MCINMFCVVVYDCVFDIARTKIKSVISLYNIMLLIIHGGGVNVSERKWGTETKS